MKDRERDIELLTQVARDAADKARRFWRLRVQGKYSDRNHYITLCAKDEDAAIYLALKTYSMAQILWEARSQDDPKPRYPRGEVK
jgi:hypothetical protein